MKLTSREPSAPRPRKGTTDMSDTVKESMTSQLAISTQRDSLRIR